ncbi:putative nucleotidyltransferase [Cytobacillus eiseniae]|uniref:tRNA(Met) cytidine acetate ligase n=1 Tax=Cytobacillus eiseniae TaxID=762947 RepID=A0ABS4RCD2_9BACI|nr:nucleotidyltransferase [Cytobacillus eiseniae]MBP2240014.1 putative nucleotidyltransferase [Cytobacillus eiseniae]
MNAVGVVVEYNPFHNGHHYHICEARKATNAEIVIAVMSGNFLQRGEPAFISKWTRTEMALKAGVDIVFELPYAFATQQANTFASGAVSILEAAGCRHLCFGSEDGQIDRFYQTLSFLEENNKEYQNKIKQYLHEGNSYPKASSLAFHALVPDEHLIDLSKPNNILGYQYIKSAKEQHASIQALTIARKNADYHDLHFSSESIASATSIRKVLSSKQTQISSIRQYVPESTFEGLIAYKEKYGLFHDWEHYWPFLKYRLVQSALNDLKKIYEIEEGLENRMQQAALQSEDFQHFMEKVKTKRYTWTRLQRACVHILTNTTKEEMYLAEEKPKYLRLLGMTTNGQKYLNKYKSNLSLPLISRLSSTTSEQLFLDLRASRVYAMAASGIQQQKLLEKEFKQPPIIIKK